MPHRHGHEEVSSLELAVAMVCMAVRWMQTKAAIALLSGIASLDEAVSRRWMRVRWVVCDWSHARLHRRRHYCAFSAVRALLNTTEVAVSLIAIPLVECSVFAVCWLCGFAVPARKLRSSISGRLGLGTRFSLKSRWVELILRLIWRWPGIP